MLKFISFIAILSLSVAAQAETQIKQFWVSKLDGAIAEFKVSICPEASPVEARVKFTNTTEEVSFAEIEFVDLRDASTFTCYANTYQIVVVDLNILIKKEMKRQKINSLGAYLKNLPVRLEVINEK